MSFVLYLVSPFSFQPFLMSTSALNERSRSNPLCDFRLGTVVTSDYETPLTVHEDSDSRQRQHTDSVRVIPPRAVRERERGTTQCRCCHAQHVAGAVFGARGDDDAGVPVPERHVARGAFGMCQCLDSTGTERDRYGSTGHADQSIIHTRDQFEKC